MFYVYAYFEPGCKEPFYIGKGSGQRAYQHTCRCRISKQRTHFYNKLRSLLHAGTEPQIVLLQKDLTELRAFELERRLIKFFKRRSEGGCLCNHTTGGEGGAGYKRQTPVTKKERRNRSTAQKGKKFTEQHRKNISKAHQKIWQDRVPSIKACDPITQEIQHLFSSTRGAERAGFDRRAIYHVLKGTRKTHKSLTWEYIHEN